MTPYPTIYCPDGIEKPACCAHTGGARVIKDAGPGGTCGMVYGGIMRPGNWRKTIAGWWLLDDGHMPQHLARMDCHPRIVRWIAVHGADKEQWWRVPVFLAPLGNEERGLWCSALDRVYDGTGYSIPDAFKSIQERLLALTVGHPFGGETVEKRDAACIQLALELLQIGQWVDGPLCALKGWLTDSVVIRIIQAAMGNDPELEAADVQH